MFIVAISRFRGRFPQFDIELRLSVVYRLRFQICESLFIHIIATDTFSSNSVTQNNEIMLHFFLIMQHIL